MVSTLCARIAQQLGLEPEHISKLRMAGLLHDVGKVGTPDAILTKAAKLTDEEVAVCREHAELGASIVRAAGLEQEARWIRYSHERIDGGGYPTGLAGDEIPMESRIILVADAYEALISDRPYRAGRSSEEAVAEIERNAGTQFDASCVAALVASLRSKGRPGSRAEVAMAA